MSSGNAKPETARLFAALDIPDRIRAGIEAWGARELADGALRPTPAENLHMTLCFLGRTEASRIEEAVRAVTALPTLPVRMRFRPSPVGKPSARPAVWALEAEAPGAEELQGRLSATLAAAGLYLPEKRPFWAHLTVARTRTEPGNRRPRRVERPPGDLPAALSEPFDAVRVALYRSDLRPDGAKYVSLAKLDLPPTPSVGEER